MHPRRGNYGQFYFLSFLYMFGDLKMVSVDVPVLLGSSAWTSIVWSSDLAAEDDFGNLSLLC